MARRTGRRPGNQDTRAAIVTAARDAFAERGYDGASIRQIATSAGVDPALVHHYFGTKEQLFAAVVNFPMNPAEYIPKVLAGGVDGAGERMVRAFVTVWDSPMGAAGVALLRTAVSGEFAARLIREFLHTQILRRAMKYLEIDPAEGPMRASLIASQMSGLGMTRYILKIEPLASADPDTIVAAVGPTIQRYLNDPLPARPALPHTPAGAPPDQTGPTE